MAKKKGILKTLKQMVSMNGQKGKRVQELFVVGHKNRRRR